MSQYLAVGVTSLQVNLSPRIASPDFTEFYPGTYEKVLEPEHMWFVPTYVFRMNNSFKESYRRILVCTYVCCKNTKRFLVRKNSLVQRRHVTLQDCDVGYEGHLLIGNSVAQTLALIRDDLNLRKYESLYNGFLVDNITPDLQRNFCIIYKTNVDSEEGTPDDATWMSPEQLITSLDSMDEFSQLIPTLASKV